jgi:hypothetical protein
MKLSDTKIKDRVRCGNEEAVVIAKLGALRCVASNKGCGGSMHEITSEERDMFALSRGYNFLGIWSDYLECEVIVPKKPIELRACKVGDRVRMIFSKGYVQSANQWSPDKEFEEIEGTIVSKRGTSYTIGWGDTKPEMENSVEEVEDLSGHKWQSAGWGNTCACYLVEEPPIKPLNKCNLGDTVEVYLDERGIPTSTKTSKVIQGFVFAKYKDSTVGDVGVGIGGLHQGLFQNTRNTTGLDGFDYMPNAKNIKFSTWIKADTQVRLIAEAPKAIDPPKPEIKTIDPLSLKNGDKIEFELLGLTHSGVMLCPLHCGGPWLAVDRSIAASTNWEDIYHKQWAKAAGIDTSKYGIRPFQKGELKILSLVTETKSQLDKTISAETIRDIKEIVEPIIAAQNERAEKDYRQSASNFDAFGKAINKQLAELKADINLLKLASFIPTSLFQNASQATAFQPGDTVSPVFDTTKLEAKVVGVISSAGHSLVLLGWKDDEAAPLEASLNYTLHSGETMSCVADIHSYKHYLVVSSQDLSLLKLVAVAPENTNTASTKHGHALSIKVSEGFKLVKPSEPIEAVSAKDVEVEAEATSKDKSSGITTAMMIGGTMLGALASAMIQKTETGVRVSEVFAEIEPDMVVETIAEVSNA